METRFPFSDDKEQIDSVFFVWKDAFKTKDKTALRSIKAEQAAILFNLGATISQQAIETDRDSENGIKLACKYFQEAAGVFALVRQTGVAKIPAAGKDLSNESSTMLENLMLAQAQECFFVKATVDGRSSGICARLAKQAELFYREAMNNTKRSPLKDRIDTEWLNHVHTKEAMMHAWCMYFLSISHRAEEDIGKEIARLQAASSVLKSARRDTGKKLQAGLETAMKSLEATVKRALEVATKENSMIYLVRVPDPSSLDQALGAPMVKSLQPEELSVPIDFFSGFVPDHCAKSLSIYTDMVDRTIRELTEQVQETSDQVRLKLREFELPELLFSLDSAPKGGYTPIPEPLATELDELNNFGGARGLQKMYAEQKEYRTSAISALAAAESTLEKEVEEDSRIRQQFGQYYMLPKSSLVDHPLRERINQFKKSLEVALDSDHGIESRLSKNDEVLRSLGTRDAAARMPKISTPMVCMEEGDIAKALQQSLVVLEKLAGERDGLEAKLRESKQKDNLLPKLMSYSDSTEELFEEEIKKYDAVKEEIKQNATRSTSALDDLVETYTKFYRVYDIPQWKVDCEKAVAGMRRDVEYFRDLKTSLEEGTNFYTSLCKASTSLRHQCGEFALSRQLQRDEMVNEMRRRRAEEEANRHAAVGQAWQSQAGTGTGAPTTNFLDAQFQGMHVSQGSNAPGRVPQHRAGSLADHQGPGYVAGHSLHQPQPSAGYAYPAIPPADFPQQNANFDGRLD
eukprot:scaffold5_cov331-Pavlova_lutheri.AAC.83